MAGTAKRFAGLGIFFLKPVTAAAMIIRKMRIGSALAARPQLMPIRTGPCCYTKIYYDTKLFEKAVVLFKSVSDEFKESDGYQYDLCDLVRQALSNRFYTNQAEFSNAYSRKDIEALKILSEKQLNLLQDMDSFLANRSEFSLSRWIEDSHRLAGDEQEKKYFDFNARTLITLWGDGVCENMLYDYSWREWSGLIGEFYFVRWKMFYDEVISQLEKGRYVDVLCTADFVKNERIISNPISVKG